MRSRSFWVGPADDNEFLAIQAFGFEPKTLVPWRIGRIDHFGNDALEPKLAGMLSDKLAITPLMVVELKAGNARDQGFQKRLALDERQIGGVAAVKMQEIETVVDEPRPARTIACGLGLCKARQSISANAA